MTASPWRIVAARALAAMLASAAPNLTFGAENFGNEPFSAWADTPRGRFECRWDESTGHHQVLKLGGRVLFQEQPGPEGIVEGETISSGIVDWTGGCTTIMANRAGYVIVVRATAPPPYGLQGYAVINFNLADPPLVALGVGQRPQDDKIPDDRRLAWSDSGVTVRYFGYPLGESGGSLYSPKPRSHEVRFDFATGEAKQIR